ncbi:MAG TPA: hypothetical protein VMB21_20680 [Candidatus Limnocylindria bacterium]|jgi:RNA polymerase sigma-70 factor (ECF subfamily)|nr:hypothetical protein [Candidatus Limnocylindria bacterium]
MLAAATLHGDERGRQALEEMCRGYWQPVFAVIRSRGRDEDDARDQTQGFFAYLLQKSALRHADRARGRFRTFLLTLLWRYLRDERERATAEKRGGAMAVSGSDEELETLPAEALPLAETLDREWALATLERAIGVVRTEVIAARGEKAWAVLCGFLPGSVSVPPMAAVAEALGLSEAGMRTEVHRLRARCREALRRDLMRTVETPGDLDAEIEYLGRTLRVAAEACPPGEVC